MEFAEKHNLIAPEEKARMEEGLVRFKEGITNAPAEVKQCLEGVVGRDNLEQLIAGRQTPKRDFGDKMRTCFESAFGAPREREMRDDEFAPREGGFPGMMRPDGEGVGMPFIQDGSTSSFRGGEPFMQGRPVQGGKFPPQVEECVKGKVGENALREIGKGDTGRDSALGQAISTCMRDFEGPRGKGSFQGGEHGQMVPPQSDRGQGTTSRMWEQRTEGQFDPRAFINPEFNKTQEYDPRMQGVPYGDPRTMPYGTMPPEGQMIYPPQGGAMPNYQYQGGVMPYGGQMPLGAPQTPSYPPISPDGMMVFPQDETGTYGVPTGIIEPVN